MPKPAPYILFRLTGSSPKIIYQNFANGGDGTFNPSPEDVAATSKLMDRIKAQSPKYGVVINRLIVQRSEGGGETGPPGACVAGNIFRNDFIIDASLLHAITKEDPAFLDYLVGHELMHIKLDSSIMRERGREAVLLLQTSQNIPDVFKSDPDAAREYLIQQFGSMRDAQKTITEFRDAVARTLEGLSKMPGVIEASPEKLASVLETNGFAFKEIKKAFSFLPRVGKMDDILHKTVFFHPQYRSAKTKGGPLEQSNPIPRALAADEAAFLSLASEISDMGKKFIPFCTHMRQAEEYVCDMASARNMKEPEKASAAYKWLTEYQRQADGAEEKKFLSHPASSQRIFRLDYFNKYGSSPKDETVYPQR